MSQVNEIKGPKYSSYIALNYYPAFYIYIIRK